MSRAPIGSSFFHAGASVDASGATLVALHCSIVRTALGVYEATLEQAIDALECVAVVQLIGPLTPLTGDIAASFIHTSDTLKTITIGRTLGIFFAPTDHDFNFNIKRIRVGTS